MMIAMMMLLATIGAIPLPEHPRPDFERTDWRNLNGKWDFGFRENAYDRQIVVPFGWGSPASGVKDDGDTGYYRRVVTVPESWRGKRVFVVVGAADHDTTCCFDGENLGCHSGGYTPFEFELTEYVKWGNEQPLEFKIWDPSAEVAMKGHYLYGKQGYGNARGIWQTVYLEARGDVYIDSVRFLPNAKEGSVTVEAEFSEPLREASVLSVTLAGKQYAIKAPKGAFGVSQLLALDSPHLWSLEDPYLYEVVLSLNDDVVKSYFGLRDVGVGKNPNGDSYVTLNGKPLYLQLTLDQSYHPEGWYTFPSDEFMKNEILISKKLALNGNRVHIKVEIPRKLYWADRLGLLIQADVPCAWGDASEGMFDEHRKCFDGMLRRDFNHPSIYQWTLFNETWGLFSHPSLKMGLGSGGNGGRRLYRESTQRKVAAAYQYAKKADPTRIIEDNSACNGDHVVTDVNSYHAYCAGFKWERNVGDACAKVFPGSTFNYIGGRVQRDEPFMNSECGNVWGYAGSTGDCDWSWDYHMMINAFRRRLKCCGWLYTEHHDVINEWNGYVRFDRTWKETGIEDLFPCMSILDFHADAFIPLDVELGRTFSAGEIFTVPVDVSLITDRYAGMSPRLEWFLHYFDSKGRHFLTSPQSLKEKLKPLASWQCSRLADVPVKLPDHAACGVICFSLSVGDRVGGKVIARNFQCFSVPGVASGNSRPVASEWSARQWFAVNGDKCCGTGSGFFEYEFPAPAAGSCVFRAEVSTKRLNGKDVPADGNANEGLDYMLGGGFNDRSRNPNSYPQTSSAHKYAGKVQVYANGELLATIDLPDDPADHRGILSWMAQQRPSSGTPKLDEAGSYGYLVEVSIPDRLVKVANGKLRIRLSAESTGLAVYGAKSGRYPFAPHVSEW